VVVVVHRLLLLLFVHQLILTLVKRSRGAWYSDRLRLHVSLYVRTYVCSMSLRTITQQEQSQLSLTNPRHTFVHMQWRDDLLKTPSPHMCYHAQFGRSSLYSVVIDKEEPQKLGSAGLRLVLERSVWLTP